jgi:RecJ-like exonuclease
MKETTFQTEPCYDCGGDGYHVNGHNGNQDRCYACKGTGKQPAGTDKWRAERKKAEEAIRRVILNRAETEIDKKIKAWEKTHQKPIGKVTTIIE